LVGPKDDTFQRSRVGALLQRDNVLWVGPKPFDCLAPYLSAIDVGLVPYTPSPFNRGSFPLKTLEYLAAGLPVVSTDLPATRWLDTQLVAIESSPAEFAAAALRRAASRRDSGEIRRRQAFATLHDWPSRARQFSTVLGIE
jgi:teichuronic acid biosynthesis glycosyltransferase TuaH